MIRRLAVAALMVAACPALAEQPAVPSPAAVEKPAVAEESPNFQPIRQVEPSPGPEPSPAPSAPPPAFPAPVAAPSAAIVAPPPAAAAPAEPAAGAAQDLPPAMMAVLPIGMAALFAVLGALLAGLMGAVMARALRRGELAQRRHAVAVTLAAELETRRLAFESVPLPPNVDAGVSFVSSVISLAGIDHGFRAAQGELFLLPPQLASHLSVHYAAVQRVADFVKGQSLAAAVRMMQANRLGGHPCPDAGAMRDAHVEMTAAFRGIDKLMAGLKTLAR